MTHLGDMLDLARHLRKLKKWASSLRWDLYFWVMGFFHPEIRLVDYKTPLSQEAYEWPATPEGQARFEEVLQELGITREDLVRHDE